MQRTHLFFFEIYETIEVFSVNAKVDENTSLPFTSRSISGIDVLFLRMVPVMVILRFNKSWSSSSDVKKLSKITFLPLRSVVHRSSTTRWDWFFQVLHQLLYPGIFECSIHMYWCYHKASKILFHTCLVSSACIA